MLELSRTTSKSGGVTGSLVFVFHLAVGLVLGAFWGAVTAGLAGAISQTYQRNAPLKVVFNVAERMLSVGLTFFVYHLLNGQSPPGFLVPGALPTLSIRDALLQLGAFLGCAVVYFGTNSALVSSVVALASGRPVFSTWRANTVWVLGYDLCASLIALLIVWVYVRTTGGPVERLGFLALCLPIVGIRHVYNKLKTLKDLFAELDRAYEQLELNVREQLAMMVKAIEARDPYTSGHSRRVCGLSRAIATDLGLSAGASRGYRERGAAARCWKDPC